MRRSAFLGLLLGLFVAFSAPSPSFAQEEGVTLDPNSPAAKEYDLPVDRARRDSSGSSGDKKSSSSGDGSSVPFGEGIGNADGTASSSAGSTAGAQAEAAAEAKAKAAAAKKKAEAKKKAAKAKAAKKRAERERAEAEAAALATTPTTPTEPISTDAVSETDTDDGSSPGLVLLGGGAIAVLLAVGGSAAFRRFRGRTDA